MMTLVMIAETANEIKLFCEGVATVVGIYGIYHGSKKVKKRKKK